jgi:hypothetical protein
MAVFAGGYGLVVGVSEYSDPAWNIPIGVRDAEAIYTALTDAAAGGYPKQQVELLLGAQATSAAVLAALGRLAARAGAGDTVFIAITSHGALVENGALYALATSDALFVGGDRIRSGTGLHTAQLATALKEIRSERLLLVINACFAGNLGQIASRGALHAAPSGAVLPNGAGDTLLASGKGRAIITASKASQRSYYQPGDASDSYSYFGQALIDGLRGTGLSSSGGYIGLFELYSVLYKQLTNRAASSSLVQEPVLSLVEGVGPFPVALYRGSQGADASLIAQHPPEYAELRTVTLQLTDNSQRNDNRKLIDFGNAQIAGGVKIGDVVQGDLVKTVYNQGGAGDGAERADPRAELQKIRGRIATLSGLPEDLREDAKDGLDNALRAFDEGNSARAKQVGLKAADIIDRMNHATAASIARKLRTLLAGLS